LLLRAYKNWDFPKGLVEPGEDALAAALREAREETGIEDLELAWGERYSETAPYNRNKVARYYLALTRTSDVRLGVSPELGRPEHHEYRWVDASTAAALTVPRVRAVVAWAAATIAAAGRVETSRP
jgi:8-oxo-dGTP pyrophosphatase MutT (NUDIX family)